MRIGIIGAGPAGSQSAYLLAQHGHEVHVFEEHECIGKPVQCTGIVTLPFQALMEGEESFVVNKIDTIRIYAPDGNDITFKFKHADWIIDRTKFDQFLADRAQKEGATYHTHHRFLSFTQDGQGVHIRVRDDNTKHEREEQFDILVGADGPMSPVAKEAGLLGERKYFFGVQPVVELENDNAIEVYPARTGFCWVTPISSHTAKAGIAAQDNANNQLKMFMAQRFGEDYKKRVITTEGGLVPVYNPRQKVQQGNVYLVGDASSAAKATTAGGIIQSLIGAKALAKSINEKNNYQALWRASLDKEMSLSLRMRRMLDKFSDTDFNKLVALLNKPRTKSILETTSRDYPSSFAFKLLLAEPRLLRYAKFAF